MKRLAPVVALLLLASPLACGRGRPETAVRINGRIEAAQVDLAAKVAGRVVEVTVREGDRVKAGDLLVRLDLGETAVAVDRDRAGAEASDARLRDLEEGSRDSEIAAAEADVADRAAAVDLARRERERVASLVAQQVASAQELDRAQTVVARAAASLDAARERLRLAREGFRRRQTDQARAESARARAVLRQSEILAAEGEIRAPADGIVLHRLAEPGQLLGAGRPALTLAFADRLYLRGFVPETAMGRVRPGMPATIEVDAFPGRSFPARVTEISPEAEFTPRPVETREERVHLVYATKIDLDAGWKEPLVPGQPAEAVVETGGAAK